MFGFGIFYFGNCSIDYIDLVNDYIFLQDKISNYIS